MASPKTAHDDELLRRLGERVRAARSGRSQSRAELAAAAGLSVRYLAELEGGSGNISVARLRRVAEALGMRTSELLASAEERASPGRRSEIIALLGLRGAGKTTVGSLLATRLDVPFVELDDLVAQAAGIPLAQVFELHGERYYRRLEREALTRYLIDNQRGVLATGGGIVTEPETFSLLDRRALTVWLKARPRDHWDRVVSQGDVRPMADRAHAMEELEALLQRREPLYARARYVVDTSALDADRAADTITSALSRGHGET